MTIDRQLLSPLAMCTLALAFATSSGCGDGDGGVNEDPVAIGLSCGRCEASFCSSSGSTVSQLCTDSDLASPCLGTATGMYCSKRCVSDQDCASPNRAMKCLTSCPQYPTEAGQCWSESDMAFMANAVCP